MVDYNIIKNFDVDDAELDRALEGAFASSDQAEIGAKVDKAITEFKPGAIISGKVVEIVGDGVVVDVGFLSVGVIRLDEFDDISSVDKGDRIEVFLEAVEDDTGMIALSKRKADRIRGWHRIIESSKEGDTVKGRVMRKIKSGLLVDIGVPVLLPARQVDIRRPGDIGEYVGQ